LSVVVHLMCQVGMLPHDKTKDTLGTVF